MAYQVAPRNPVAELLRAAIDLGYEIPHEDEVEVNRIARLIDRCGELPKYIAELERDKARLIFLAQNDYDIWINIDGLWFCECGLVAPEEMIGYSTYEEAIDAAMESEGGVVR